MKSYDVCVIGAGFGGLGAALELARGGAKVVLLEMLNYLGGCAGTFQKAGYRFEAGATLSSGLGPGQLFRRWIDEYELDVRSEGLDPIVDFRCDKDRLLIPGDRGDFIRQFSGAENPHNLERFFREQKVVADKLWGVLNDPELLPPFSGGSLLSHIRRSPNYLGLLRWIGRPFKSVLQAYGLDKAGLFRSFLDATSQITVQCGVDEAEALFAMSTLDYYFRGTQHIRGGLGELAKGLGQALEKEGGDLLLTRRVKTLRKAGGRWQIETTKESFEAPVVVANLLPGALTKILNAPVQDNARLERWQQSVETGWGACMLYRVVKRPKSAKAGACHLQLIQDPTALLQDGNHLFCSISGSDETERAPEGYATMTVSTHVGQGDKSQKKIEEVQQRMREGLARLAPEWGEDIQYEVSGSPRTFERFTGRPGGFVGGVPRRAGLGNYKDLFPKSVGEGLYLVGDSVFPGQSTLATALGGHRVAHTILRS